MTMILLDPVGSQLIENEINDWYAIDKLEKKTILIEPSRKDGRKGRDTRSMNATLRLLPMIADR